MLKCLMLLTLGFKSFSAFLELNVCPSGQFSKPRFSQVVL